MDRGKFSNRQNYSYYNIDNYLNKIDLKKAFYQSEFVSFDVR